MLLNVLVTLREPNMLVNGIVLKQLHRCSTGKTVPCVSLTSHTIRLTSSFTRDPVLTLLVYMLGMCLLGI